MDTVTLDGQIYDSKVALRERFKVSNMTLQRWRERGLLPEPVRIGKYLYFRRDELERRLVGRGNAA